MFKKEVIAAIVNGTVLFDDLSDELRGDKEVVMIAVRKRGCALKFASEELKGDKDVVIAAVEEDGDAIKYVSSKLRGDKEVVGMSIKSSAWAYIYGVEEVQRNLDVIALANQNLRRFGKSVDDFLCDELVELKKKYGVDTLVLALEMEAAEMESARLLSSSVVKRDVEASLVKKL